MAKSFRDALPITPNDGAELDRTTGSIWVGSTGNLKVLMAVKDDDLEAITILSVPAGTLLPLKVRKVFATGTTASNLLALYD